MSERRMIHDGRHRLKKPRGKKEKQRREAWGKGFITNAFGVGFHFSGAAGLDAVSEDRFAAQTERMKVYYAPDYGVRHSPGYFLRLQQFRRGERKAGIRTMSNPYSTMSLASSADGRGLTMTPEGVRDGLTKLLRAPWFNGA